MEQPSKTQAKSKLGRFLAKSNREKYAALARLAMRTIGIPAVPVRLSFGAWWLAGQGVLDERLLNGDFETAELEFVQHYLQAGMTVLDIGAHHGLYTLLASSRVGPTGRVIAFEPSSRERTFLRRHLRVNRCQRVSVEGLAVGRERGKAPLFLADGGEDGCNSLRPLKTAAHCHTEEVEVISLDEYLVAKNISEVHFIKLDIEGAELDALKGAGTLFGEGVRPVVLAEVYEIRSQPWGYRSREIVEFLEQQGYRWYKICEDGKLVELDTSLERFDANLVGVPAERAVQLALQIKDQRNPNAED